MFMYYFSQTISYSYFKTFFRFWQLLSPFSAPYPIISHLPLVSSFSRGCGRRVAVDGKVTNLIF